MSEKELISQIKKIKTEKPIIFDQADIYFQVKKENSIFNNTN